MNIMVQIYFLKEIPLNILISNDTTTKFFHSHLRNLIKIQKGKLSLESAHILIGFEF